MRVLCSAVTAAAALVVLAEPALAEETNLVLAGSIVYRTSQKPVAGRALWFRHLADPADLAARPGYSASLVSATTDAEGRFRYDLPTRSKVTFGLGLGLGSFLHRADGEPADDFAVEAGAEGTRDLGVLVAPDVEETVPAAAAACEAGMRGAAAPVAGLGFLVLLKRPGEFFRPWDKKSSEERQKRAPWEFDAALQERIAAHWNAVSRTLVCIVETKTSIGEYPGIRPSWAGPLEAFRTDWDIRLLTGESKIEKTGFAEDPPQATTMMHSGASVLMKRRPDQDLKKLPQRLAEWLAKKRAGAH